MTPGRRWRRRDLEIGHLGHSKLSARRFGAARHALASVSQLSLRKSPPTMGALSASGPIAALPLSRPIECVSAKGPRPLPSKPQASSSAIDPLSASPLIAARHLSCLAGDLV